MDLSTFKCPKCEYSHVNLNSLRTHWQKLHKEESINLRLALFHDNVRPKCECGCNEETEFETLQHGFKRFVNGHNARVSNGWGHNKIALKKSQEVRRGMWSRGEIKAWRKGLSLDDPRNKALIEKMTNTNRTDVFLKQKRSEIMRKNRLDGTIRTLRGSEHSQWKGGTSALQPIVRAHLYKVWTYPKLKLSEFKCCSCGTPGPGLEVHHDQERFAAILQKAIVIFGEIDMNVAQNDFEKKALISKWVADYHVKNNISGLVLCEICHLHAHSSAKLTK